MIPFVFIDRDGTLIYNIPYLKSPAGVELTPGAGPALRKLADAGFKIALVTNQSGIGRGLFTREELDRVNDRLRQLLDEFGAKIDAIYICPHAPDAGCDCRKPHTGLLKAACRDFDVDRQRSVMLGDSDKDILLGKNFGLKTVQIRLNGTNADDFHADYLAESIPDALPFILSLL